MTTQYDPSELDKFLDGLEQGKYDDGAEQAPNAEEPQQGESQGEDDFDVDEFTVGGQSAAQPAAPDNIQLLRQPQQEVLLQNSL